MRAFTTNAAGLDETSPHGRPSDRSILLALVLLGLLARVAGIAVLDLQGLIHPGNEHWVHARSLYGGAGFAFDWYGLFEAPVVGSFLPPLYPALIALLLVLSGGSESIALILAQGINAILGAATVAVVAHLVETGTANRAVREDLVTEIPDRSGPIRPVWRRIAGTPPLLAAGFWALYPPAVGLAAVPNTTVLESFLLATLAWMIARCSLQARGFTPRSVDRLLAGLLFGLLLLLRPSAGLIWLLWGLLILRRRTGARSIGRTYLAATLVAFLVITPWTIRNAKLHGRPVPISTNGGFNFFVGNNPYSRGEILNLSRYFVRMPEVEKERWRSRTELERDREFYRMGLSYWREQPLQALQSVGNKLVSFTFFRPYLLAGYPRWLAVVYLGSYLLLLIPFTAALVRGRGRGHPLLLLAIVGTGIICLVFITSMRFRSSVEPLMAVIASDAFGRRRRADLSSG